MQLSLREDYLEAIQNFIEKYSHPPLTEELAAALGKPEPVVRSDLDSLISLGDVSRLTGGFITLTGQGQQTGRRVIKKHETLQCFLSEILGMDSSSASEEACTLEHAISDDTIDRLGELIGKKEGRGHRGRGRQRRKEIPLQCSVDEKICQYPSISDCREGEGVTIHCIHGRACAKRILDLGMVPGEHVSIKRKLSNGALVVQVKGCDVALSPEVASEIGVERSP
ncbi:MAG: metal-dependent transcriptional regulator [Methanoregulaceae archaeon]|jgi:DtxR family Mn-dependent transcriptional regulator|nr:metal-dependent transcriptional regulator [Methanoregulaceae archaeon]